MDAVQVVCTENSGPKTDLVLVFADSANADLDASWE
jgi:hypothetical protein